MKCEYCQQEITGRSYRHDRMPKFKIATEIPKGDEVKPWLPIQNFVCKECLDDMGIKV